MTSVLIGGPAKETDSSLFMNHETCLKNQTVKTEVKHYLDKGGDGYDVGEKLHRWDKRAIERVAILRQNFLSYFLQSGHDYACMVDTDVLIGPDVVRRLVVASSDYGADVAYGVFWSDWGSGPQPQTWLHYPYDRLNYPGVPEFYTRLQNGETMPCHGGGACTLISRDAAEKARYYPLFPGLPPKDMWMGEDRTFGLLCIAHKLKQIAVGGLHIQHLYTPEQRTQITRAMEIIGQ